MTDCKLCQVFEGSIPLTSIDPLCEECRVWLNKVVSVRRRYLNMLSEEY